MFLLQNFLIHLLFVITTKSSSTQTPLQIWRSLLESCSDKYNVRHVRAYLIMARETEVRLTLESEKCFVKCMDEGLGYLNPDGSLKEASLYPVPWFLNPNKVRPALRKCKRIIGTSACDKAYQQTLCFFGIASVDVNSDEYI